MTGRRLGGQRLERIGGHLVAVPDIGPRPRQEYEGNWTAEPWNGTGRCASCEHNGDVHQIAGVCMVTGCECDLWDPPISARPSVSPEADTRAAMSDGEFWAHVYPQTECEDEGPSLIDQEDIASLTHLANPCPECGQSGACAYDAEGRPMIHTTSEDDE